jgi:tRNA uridine 5-carbamoylmethylation protein Kti12
VTVIINLYGGPGIGKSTCAAYLYYLLKSQHKSVELVREYVKVWAWDNRKIRHYDQPHIVSKQIRDESLLYDKTDFLVTDSPVAMNLYYASLMSETIGCGIKELIRSFYKQCEIDGHKHVNLLLQRVHPYDDAGRYQTAEEANQVDQALVTILENDFQLPYLSILPTEEDLFATMLRILNDHG